MWGTKIACHVMPMASANRASRRFDAHGAACQSSRRMGHDQEMIELSAATQWHRRWAITVFPVSSGAGERGRRG